MSTQSQRITALEGQLANIADMLTAMAGNAAQPEPEPEPRQSRSRKASTAAKSREIRRNLDPVSVPMSDTLTAKVQPTTAAGKLLRAPRCYVVETRDNGSEYAVKGLTAEHIAALSANASKIKKAFATVTERAYPDA